MAGHRLGGDFSMRWTGRPTTPPSAPPPPETLPDPGVDAASEVCAECEPEAAGGGSGPPALSRTQIQKMNKKDLEEACAARELVNGTCSEMRSHLRRYHELDVRDNTGAAADGDADAPPTYEVEKIEKMRVKDNGCREFFVSWVGYRSKTWEPECNLDDCGDKLAAFFNDSNFTMDKEACKYGHRQGVCLCHRPLFVVGHDESIFRAYSYSCFQWIVEGVRSLRKKCEGPGEMMSAFQDRIRGFGFPLTAPELEKVNVLREAHGRPPLTSSPGVRFLCYGKNKDGYWDNEKFTQQCVDFIDAFEALHPDWQLCVEVDWSSGHAAHSPGSLNVTGMNVKYGGAQKTPRESTIDPACPELYLGEHPAKMTWNDRELDLKLKPGDTQHFYFRPGDPPPFYDVSAPATDTTSTSRKRKNGEFAVKEGYIGKPKGMMQIAWERGLVPPDGKMHGRKVADDADDDEKLLSLPHVLSRCWDFEHAHTALEELFLSRGHILRMGVKCHPEMAGRGIEWDRAARHPKIDPTCHPRFDPRFDPRFSPRSSHSGTRGAARSRSTAATSTTASANTSTPTWSSASRAPR